MTPTEAVRSFLEWVLCEGYAVCTLNQDDRYEPLDMDREAVIANFLFHTPCACDNGWREGEPPVEMHEVLMWFPGMQGPIFMHRHEEGWANVYIKSSWLPQWRWMPVPPIPVCQPEKETTP